MEKYRFKAQDFYRKKDEQNECCALTGIKLEPHTCDVAHVVPLHKGGEHEYANIELVHKDLVKLARILTDDEIFDYATLIVKYLGKSKGFRITKVNK